jgi:hypothetical protein
MRKVTFIDSKSQSQKVINNSEATTLGELKAEMRTAGIDYTDMSFYEGHIRAELLDDSSILPTNIPYKGQVVNDLVFMLSTTNKKIKSGIDRYEVYQQIKNLNLQEEVKNIFNRNYTQVPTDDLLGLIARYSVQVTSDHDSEEVAPCLQRFAHLENVIMDLVELLYNYDVIDEEDYTDFADKLNFEVQESKDQKMTPQEIDEMFNFMN